MAVDVVILGAGGHGAETASYVRALGKGVRLLGCVDDDARRSSPIAGVKLLGSVAWLLETAAKRGRALRYITAAGDNAVRRRLVERVEAAGLRRLQPWTLQHPRSSIGRDAVQVGEGSCLAPGSIVTTRARIGRHCILNVKASVAHDCVVGDFCNLNPGSTLCGNVTLGEGCFIGAGATVIPGVSIGAWTTVGAGAVVVGDLPARVLAVGVPARVVK